MSTLEEKAAVRTAEPLDRAECLHRLRTHPTRLGRLALPTVRPLILPVNYALDGKDLVFRTGRGTKLDVLRGGGYVAFEVDDVDPEWRTGWSVVVRGPAREVTDPDELLRLRSLPLVPWVDGTQPYYVRIVPELISGRELMVASLPVD